MKAVKEIFSLIFEQPVEISTRARHRQADCKMFHKSPASPHPKERDSQKQAGLSQHNSQKSPAKIEKRRRGNQNRQAGPDQRGFIFKLRRAMVENGKRDDDDNRQIGHPPQFAASRQPCKLFITRAISKAVCAASVPRLCFLSKQRSRACNSFSSSKTSWMTGTSCST